VESVCVWLAPTRITEAHRIPVVRGLMKAGLCLPVIVCLLTSGCGASRSGDRPLTSTFSSEPVQFLSGGMETVAQGRVPGAAGFSLLAERYRFQHRTYFNLAAHVREIGGGSRGTNFTPQPSKPLAWSTEQGCSPSATMWTIVFGVLADSYDRAYAYTSRRRYPLWTATIPTRFHASGVAAYVALPEQPIRILVTTASGATLMREQLEPAPPEHCRPGSSIIVFRKHTSGKTG
jgi:hypothetical protein